jgi:hypothetical protein
MKNPPLLCPTGNHSKFLSIPPSENKSLSEIKNYDKTNTSRPHEGRNASSRFVVRAAMDVHLAARRAAEARTVKPCGPVPPMLGSSLLMRCRPRGRLRSAGDGDYKARYSKESTEQP